MVPAKVVTGENSHLGKGGVSESTAHSLAAKDRSECSSDEKFLEKSKACLRAQERFNWNPA